MTIKEWLTPGFFEINVVLVSLMICWTIFAIASNFLVDFKMSAKAQSANYFAVALMSVAYALLVVVLDPIETIYPNPYDFLLIGNWPVLGSILFGLVGGVILAAFFGDRRKLMIGAAAAAGLCECGIGGATLLWILSQ